MTIADHHETVAGLLLTAQVPTEVQGSFDRARSIFLFAWYDYELLVPAEIQALAAFELALQIKLRNAGHIMRGTMRNLIEKARKCQILPPLVQGANPGADPFETILEIRNALAHGTTDIHTPAIAFSVLETCAMNIEYLFV